MRIWEMLRYNNNNNEYTHTRQVKHSYDDITFNWKMKKSCMETIFLGHCARARRMHSGVKECANGCARAERAQIGK